jgi:UDP-sugar transporter A1/2/3
MTLGHFMFWSFVASTSLAVNQSTNPSILAGSSQTQGVWIVGFTAVLGACLGSGFAGVYFEKILKGSTTSLWLKNIQLSVYGVIISIVALYSTENTVAEHGFFYGYTQFVSVMKTGFSLIILVSLILHAID